MAKKQVKIDIGIARGGGKMDNEIGFLVEKYLERHPSALADDGAIDIESILDWAFQSGIYQPPVVDPRTQLRRRVTRHLGHRYIRTDKGRIARALVAVPRDRMTRDGVKRSFGYFPLLETVPEIIELGLDLRRGWAYTRVKGIKNDRLAYIESNIFGATLKEISFNFDAMLKRDEMPTEYPKSAPDDIDEEDDKPED